jgi:hypothetical protein
VKLSSFARLDLFDPTDIKPTEFDTVFSGNTNMVDGSIIVNFIPCFVKLRF